MAPIQRLLIAEECFAGTLRDFRLDPNLCSYFCIALPGLADQPPNAWEKSAWSVSQGSAQVTTKYASLEMNESWWAWNANDLKQSQPVSIAASFEIIQ